MPKSSRKSGGSLRKVFQLLMQSLSATDGSLQTNPILRKLDALHFPSDKYLRHTVAIPVYNDDADPTCRIPVFEAILISNAPLHQMSVYLKDQFAVRHKFIIGFKHEPASSKNHSLEAICADITWRGELVAMKGGKRDDVIGLRASDTEMVLVAIERFVFSCRL